MKRLPWIPLPILAVVLVMALVFPLPVSAIADPDSPPEVNAVYVFDFDDGSLGVLIDYYLEYAVTPNETASEAYFAVLTDTDGATQLKAVAPYTFIDSGYGHGLVWIPFTSAEVTSYGITSANQTDYRVWLIGNPTLSWNDGSPPKTIATIESWQSTGDMAVILAQRVLYYADQLELEWSLDMVESTALGNRLTTVGESYFDNVIPNLRTLAPACYSASTIYPSSENLSYLTLFGAVAYNGTAVVSGSPVALDEGDNIITITGAGVFSVILSSGTTGNITEITATITGSPADLVEGTNNVTCTAVGTANITVSLHNTQATHTSEVEGTGFDLTAIATAFGMSRIMFSGLLWFGVTILLCAATYGWGRQSESLGASGAGNATMLIFVISLIGGGLLGLLDLRILAGMSIGYAAFLGYIFFFRNSGGDIGKVIMFMGWMWFVVCLVGGILVGSNPHTSTFLVEDITATDTTITVASTEGFRDTGSIVIGDERAQYHKLTDTEFKGTFLRPLLRGTNGTEASAHLIGDRVRMVEGAMLNDSLNYNIALLSDASGLMAFVSLPIVVWDIITSFIFLPISFLGTDMFFLTYIWGIIGLGLLVSIFIAMAGGRRV